MLGGTVLCLTVFSCSLYGQCQGVRDRVLRLHIIANSDSTVDQQLKLKVRDAVLAAGGDLLAGSADREDALCTAAASLSDLEAVAQQTVRDAGFAYSVRATVGEAYFPTREYGAVTLPAGRYEAVRFVIGEGKGHNWWCVLFPPLCVGAAVEEKTLSDVLEPGQQALVNGGQKYVIRFKCVEWIESLLNRWRRNAP